MPRRVWIITKQDKVKDSDKADALLNGCTEIANGIPPVLQGVISEGQLPYVFEGPETPPDEPPRDLAAEIDELKARVAHLEPKEM